MIRNELIVCARCVLDTTVSDITFDEQGICNYCHDYDNRIAKITQKKPEVRKLECDALINRIKKDGTNKKYDCIVGVSGGVDSSWALIQAKKMGLRPLAVHMDNGWNSELAQNNIENLVRMLEIDLYTHVIEWTEYKSLMQAFFDADVIDVELLYDNAMLAVNYNLAKKHNVKWILSGCNMSTEGVRVPTGWNWLKKDKRNIKAIAETKKIKLKSFPSIGTAGYIYFEFIKKIKWLPFLDYFEFDKEQALNCLEVEYGYKRYPYKHYESVFTRFYQGYLLPEKFNVDKRKLHFSSLILSGQMSRKIAINNLNEIPYPSQNELDEDMAYFLKKMRWTTKQLNEYISRPEVSHDKFPTEKNIWDYCRSMYFSIVKNK
ncbi:N-acetyl sugar amidotransferase [Vibrio scophthalmi]|uniref:N-acetyl sugar amidotransferase n=1 Tax=Vibrio scophthalmi TaxID=45658 RepID=UPI003AAB1615